MLRPTGENTRLGLVIVRTTSQGEGNKRTGYILLRMFLIQNGVDISATQEEKYEFVIGIASGKIKYEQILDWLQKHITK